MSKVYKLQHTTGGASFRRHAGGVGLRRAIRKMLQAVLMRAAAFFLFAGAPWALLPFFVRKEIGGGPDVYGLFLTAIGAGAVWGVYGMEKLATLSGASVDWYYLGFEDEEAEYTQGRDHETRHSVGARLWGASGSWDYNFEALYQ